MEFKSKKNIITQENPFANDKLNRKNHIKNLSTLLLNISSPIVVSINAPWGCGKTTFLEMLNADLRNSACKTVYYSAWETDFAPDPLLAFLGEMNKEIELIIKDNKNKNIAWENTKKAGKHILKNAIPAIIKVSTAGIIDAEKIIEDESSKFMEGLSKDYIKEYLNNKTAIAKFKEGIEKILNKNDTEITKLYVIIDELDRCRPTYAVELLERIKHLLDINGLVFVLALDKLQLSHSIKAIYGSEFDSLGYLRRFIDIEYTLPRVELNDFIDEQYNHFGFTDFFQKRKNYSAFQNESSTLKNTFKLLADAKQLSLREIEQLFARINLVILSTEENVHLYPVLLVFLILAKDHDINIYYTYMNEDSPPNIMIDFLYKIIPEDIRVNSHECHLIEGFIIGAKYDEYKNKQGNTLLEHEKIVNNPNIDTKIKRYSESIIKLASSFSGFRNEISLSSLKERIDMSESFKF